MKLHVFVTCIHHASDNNGVWGFFYLFIFFFVQCVCVRFWVGDNCTIAVN